MTIPAARVLMHSMREYDAASELMEYIHAVLPRAPGSQRPEPLFEKKPLRPATAPEPASSGPGIDVSNVIQTLSPYLKAEGWTPPPEQLLAE